MNRLKASRFILDCRAIHAAISAKPAVAAFVRENFAWVWPRRHGHAHITDQHKRLFDVHQRLFGPLPVVPDIADPPAPAAHPPVKPGDCPVCGDDAMFPAGEPFPCNVLQCRACGAHYEPCDPRDEIDWEEVSP
jgi:hypothetical protein